MKIFSRPHPGLLSGILMVTTVALLLTMRIRGDISLVSAAGCILLTMTFWLSANFVVGRLRAENIRYQEQVQKLWRRIQQGNSPVRVVPPDDRRDPRRVPRSVELFRKKYPLC